MKIKRVIASDFGCLSGSYTLFDDRVNVVVEANEEGKSTLVAAILAGLYGFSRSRRADKLSDKEAYKPWSSDSYCVRLEMEDDEGRPLLIERDFGEKNEKVKVTDLSTNKDVTPEFVVGKKRFAVGERLLGVSREVFVKTCLVKQLEIEKVGESSELVSKVQQIFDTTGGKGTAAEAIAVLTEAIREYAGTQRLARHITVETEIKRLNEAIRQGEARMGELRERREKAEPAMIRVRELRRRLEKLEVHRQQLEYLTRRAEIREVETELKQDAENHGELKKLIELKNSLKPYSDFTNEQASDFARLVGQLDGLRKRRKELGESLEKLKKNLEETKTKLKEYDGFEALGEDFKTGLHDLSTELKRLGEDVEKKRRLVSEFEKSLKKEGYELSEVDELHRQFSKLSVEEKDLLRDSESRIPRLEASILERADAERECKAELRGVKRPITLLSYAAVVLWVAGILSMVFWAGRAQWAGGAFGLAGFVAVAVAFVLRVLKLRRLRGLLRRKEAAIQERQSFLGVRGTLSRALEEMAAKAEFESIPELTEAFKRWGRVSDRKTQLDSFRIGQEGAERSAASCREKASAELRRMGMHVPPAKVDVALVQKAETRVREYLQILSSAEQAEKRRTGTEDEIRKLNAEREKLRESIRGILVAAKLSPDLTPEKAQPEIEKARGKSEKFHRLAATEIPEKQRDLLSPEEVKGMMERLDTLRDEIEKMVGEKGELEELQVTKTHSQYEEEARRVAEEGARATEEKSQFYHKVHSVEEEYRKEYPRLANELSELTQTLDRTERFGKSISLAIDTLETISSKSHALWANELNPRTSEILKHLNPRCGELKFASDLSFTVVPAEGLRPMDTKHIEAQESVGARHQIYLAVRLALSDYLSSAGNKVPVILDEPFATSDDDRFISGMQFLCGEFRSSHQVIILTCHRQRHTDLLRQRAAGVLDHLRIIQLGRLPD